VNTIILLSGLLLGALITSLFALAFINIMRRRHFAEICVLEDQVEKLRIENARLRRPFNFQPRAKL
jgi:hypothetical protein